MARRAGLAVLAPDDEDDQTPPDALRPWPARAGPACSRAASHTALLLLLWAAVVCAKVWILGASSARALRAPTVVALAALYFATEVAVSLAWPDITEHLVQAGVFHIATVMFSNWPAASLA